MPKNTAPSSILDANGKPIAQEIASIKREIGYANYVGALPEGDKVARNKGQGKGVGIYDEVANESVVADKLGRRVMGLVSRRWEVTPDSDDALDVQAAEWIDGLLDRIPFDLLCKELDEDCLLKGRAIQEIIWGAVSRKGEPRPMIEPVAFKKRTVTRFNYNVDGQLHLRTSANISPGELMPANKFIVHRRKVTDENPYGLGLGPVLYWPVFFKRKGIAFWLTFADKFGNPTVVGKYAPGTSQLDQNKLLEALGAMSQDTGVIIPDGTIIDLLEATRSGVDTYEKLCRYMDEMISRPILHGTDSSRDAGGALKAAADEKSETFLALMQADSDLMTMDLQRDLIRPLVEWNFPGAGIPRVWRNFEPGENLAEAIKVDTALFDAGFLPDNPGEYVSEKYGGRWNYTKPADATAMPDAATKAFMDKLKSATAKPAQVDASAANFAESEKDAPDLLLDRALAEAGPAIRAMIAPIQKLVADSGSYAEVLNGMANLYGDLPTADFADVMELAIHVAALGGRYEVQLLADAANRGK
jgi:phage gp29-like protein